MSSFFKNMDIMTKALNAAWKRDEVISNNIANAETPNFKKSHVVFEELLQKHLRGGEIAGNTTHHRHINIGIKDLNNLTHKVVTPQNYETRRDGNNVDIDVEMAELAKNTIVFNTVSTQLNNDIKRLKTVINEGRR
ncbi:flagellar basal body rod protein FlgB [Clostridium formicaceticum]|uniref:Flagellar basal body rod protein FlgB n=1 Tax=Clostridium formicaceticum TaxID=1497 RepID=A0AAC9WGJ1_9CLOT|nr:flagellar basal body rod protein FlgB [Clostridium formicaceticum]AOY77325.1 flagellar basal-body rod protein FlgB [Clostridium formicaceticum]ARE87869.1 Flagellar basal body rod protein FlgB [Clostridium formicaceticum]